MIARLYWSYWWESNPQPARYECAALPLSHSSKNRCKISANDDKSQKLFYYNSYLFIFPHFLFLYCSYYPALARCSLILASQRFFIRSLNVDELPEKYAPQNRDVTSLLFFGTSFRMKILNIWNKTVSFQVSTEIAKILTFYIFVFLLHIFMCAMI